MGTGPIGTEIGDKIQHTAVMRAINVMVRMLYVDFVFEGFLVIVLLPWMFVIQ